jgi:hypothetical protein
MRSRLIRHASEKADLIKRLSDAGVDLAIRYEEPPDAHSKLTYTLRSDGAVVVTAPYDYDSLEAWLYCGNWDAFHPPVFGFPGIDTFRARPAEIEAVCERSGVALLIDSLHDDIEWNVVEREVHFLPDEVSPRIGAKRSSSLVFAVASAVAFVLAIYMVLWATSASNLAFADCHGRFSIDDLNVRCQRPVWLTYAFWLFTSLGALFAAIAFAFRSRRRSQGYGKPQGTS